MYNKEQQLKANRKFRENNHRREVYLTETTEQEVSKFLRKHALSWNSFSNKASLEYIRNHEKE